MKEKEAADRIIAHVYEHVGEFSARLIAPVSPKQFAAAGLMRCCRLLNGMFVLYGARMPELAGILARQLWEAWVVSLYVLLAKDEAMKVIDGDDFYWKSRIVDYLGVEDDYYHLESAKRSEKLNYKKVSDRVLELLRGRELVDCPGATIYDVVYGWESVFSTHANRTTIGGHLVKKGDGCLAVSVDSRLPLPNVATPVFLTCHLAKYVFKEFGLDGDAIAPFVADLGAQSADDADIRF